MNTLTIGGIIFIGAGLAVAAAKSLLGGAAAHSSPKGRAHPELHTSEVYGKSYLVGGLCIAAIGVVVLIIGLVTR